MAADSKYFPYACLVARRILDVSAPIDGFILHVKADESDIQVARRLLGDRVALLDVSDFMERVGFRFGTYSIAAYVRLFADLLPQFDGYGRIAYT
ncbi:MAG: hypothetical protein E5X04_01100, partial [Mesorhizobium sp.]